MFAVPGTDPAIECGNPIQPIVLILEFSTNHERQQIDGIRSEPYMK